MDRTLQAAFKLGFRDLTQQARLPPHHWRAARQIAACRTAVLGGHIQRCDQGHLNGVWYNSCKHRSCPQCNQIRTEQWLERQRARLLDCPHHHLIFTIPHELLPLWRFNAAAMAGLLFRAVSQTLMTLTADPRHMGAVPGLLCALHTWGRDLALHPHIHCLITDGGLDEQGQWQSPRRSCFLPARVVMALFRGKFLALLRQGLRDGRLQSDPAGSKRSWDRCLNQLGRKKWNVRLETRYEHGRGLLAYLSRYVRSGPLSNRQILSLDRQQVRFGYFSHRDRVDEGQRKPLRSLTFKLTDFLQRVLWHIPAPRQQTSRSYGLYATTKTATLDQARQHFGQLPFEAPEPIAWQAYLTRRPQSPARGCCRICGQALHHGVAVASTRGPPL
jgi:hypothetical protein